MNGIDIASWQTGIDLTKVPCDFCIVKATQDTGYVNPDFKRAFEQGLAAGKLMGIYHYAGGSAAVKEADFFLKTIKPYIGKAILVLDWESAQNSAYGKNDVEWCMAFLDRVAEKTNATPFLYISSSLMAKFAPVIAKYKMWAAQYPDYSAVRGYKQTPWNEGAYDCDIRQYTSCGVLPGWTGRLDLNKAYITKEEWLSCQDAAQKPQNEPQNATILPTISRDDEGHQNEAVRAFQTLCNLRLSSGLTVDGYFGTNTEAACRSVQKRYKLTVDGICGQQTWLALINGK